MGWINGKKGKEKRKGKGRDVNRQKEKVEGDKSRDKGEEEIVRSKIVIGKEK